VIVCNYTIVLAGELGPDLWIDFYPAVIATMDGTTTIWLEGADQAALHAALERTRSLGLVLLEVSRPPDDENRPSRECRGA